MATLGRDMRLPVACFGSSTAPDEIVEFGVSAETSKLGPWRTLRLRGVKNIGQRKRGLALIRESAHPPKLQIGKTRPQVI
jgi:hypothetical protein